jgi:hypothetical protein
MLLEDVSRNKFSPGSNITFYVLYPFVTYLLTLPRTYITSQLRSSYNFVISQRIQTTSINRNKSVQMAWCNDWCYWFLFWTCEVIITSFLMFPLPTSLQHLGCTNVNTTADKTQLKEGEIHLNSVSFNLTTAASSSYYKVHNAITIREY